MLVNTDLSSYNTYTGGVYQQSCSVLTSIPDASYEETGSEYVTFAYEMYGNKDDRDGGYITWVSDGVEAWTLKAPGLASNPLTGVGQRLIPEEPMALVVNLGLSDNFQYVDKANLNFPSEMKIEYIRVYQREDFGSVGCDPAGKSKYCWLWGPATDSKADLEKLCPPQSDHPTADYIARHSEAYNNPNLTTWELTGNTVPKNALRDGC